MVDYLFIYASIGLFIFVTWLSGMLYQNYSFQKNFKRDRKRDPIDYIFGVFASIGWSILASIACLMVSIFLIFCIIVALPSFIKKRLIKYLNSIGPNTVACCYGHNKYAMKHTPLKKRYYIKDKKRHYILEINNGK